MHLEILVARKPFAIDAQAREEKMDHVARHYALRLWKRPTIFLEYPELELGTNLVENSMRPIATGRRNWIYIGSKQTGHRGDLVGHRKQPAAKDADTIQSDPRDLETANFELDFS